MSSQTSKLFESINDILIYVENASLELCGGSLSRTQPFSCDSFVGPKNRNSVSWEDMSISPTNLISIDEVQSLMEADEFFKYKCNHVVQYAVYFLYGVEYKKRERKEDRVQGIQNLVTRQDNRLRRLVDFAFNNNVNKASLTEESMHAFLRTAVVLKYFFVPGVTFGRFPGAPCIRFQRQPNDTCYQAATSVWASLVIRHQRNQLDHDEDAFMLEIGQYVRRYALSDRNKVDTRIEACVIHNDDDPISGLASLITNGIYQFEMDLAHSTKWTFFPKFDKLFWDAIKNCSEPFGPGLIMNFTVAELFKAAAKRAPSAQYGYWKFSGNHMDDKGEFISVDKIPEYEMDLRQIVEKEIRTAQEAQERLVKGTERLFGSTETANMIYGKDDRKIISDINLKPFGKHAMVLLGGIVEWEKDPIRQKKVEKYYFLCLNSWVAMPLVLLSAEYLLACGAKVLFRNAKIDETVTNGMHVSTNRVVDCSSPCADQRGNFSALIFEHNML